MRGLVKQSDLELRSLRKQPKSPKWCQVSRLGLVMFLFHIGKVHELTLPEQQKTLNMGWLEYDRFLLGPIFRGELLVLGSIHEMDLAHATQET